MRNINLRYVDEAYDENGLLTKFDITMPDNFNFAYDVVDDIAINDPDAPPWSGAIRKGGSMSSPSPT